MDALGVDASSARRRKEASPFRLSDRLELHNVGPLVNLELARGHHITVEVKERLAVQGKRTL